MFTSADYAAHKMGCAFPTFINSFHKRLRLVKVFQRLLCLRMQRPAWHLSSPCIHLHLHSLYHVLTVASFTTSRYVTCCSCSVVHSAVTRPRITNLLPNHYYIQPHESKIVFLSPVLWAFVHFNPSVSQLPHVFTCAALQRSRTPYGALLH
jgi:hypothetical protein